MKRIQIIKNNFTNIIKMLNNIILFNNLIIYQNLFKTSLNIKMEERKVVFTDYQKAELENSFKKFNPNKEGKISLESVHNLLNSLDTSPQPKPKMNQKGLILASNEQQE